MTEHFFSLSKTATTSCNGLTPESSDVVTCKFYRAKILVLVPKLPHSLAAVLARRECEYVVSSQSLVI